MKIKNIFYSSHFRNAFRKIPPAIQKKAFEKENLFRQDCFHPALKTHKLKGELKDFWAFSIDRSFRIMFSFEDNGAISLIDIGTHSIYE
jgi:mRNA-degrading endonuclease YafQ of YafQ-DinJ toxin-antitoxin module